MMDQESGGKKVLTNRSRGRAPVYLLIGLMTLTIVGSLAAVVNGAAVPASSPGEVPIVDAEGPLCDFGVNADGSIDQLDMSPLRIGWYLNYQASPNPSEPNGADYAPLISISQVGQNGFAYAPSGSELQAAIAGNPGATWLIGNEPDAILQNNLEPHVYASAYHELYYLIKGVDPTAKIFAGSIVQATEVRLMYLDMVLDSYEAAEGSQMPVDGWSIHGFILNEVSCDLPDCWGAQIPPGVDVLTGEILTVDDNDNLVLFAERIERFRQWMADRGYLGFPLYLTEYGILMPPFLGFPPSRVNDFMNNTFNYLLNTTDVRLGNPNDEYRLVQKLSWYSTTDTYFNGWLFDPDNLYQLSPMGLNYAAYVAGIESEIDLYPSLISIDPSSPFSPVDPVTMTLSAAVANSGNMITPTGPVTVRFFDGDPDAAGEQIGEDQFVSLVGCGDHQIVSVTWSDVAPGAHTVFVIVDPQGHIEESDEGNNTTSRVVVVASDRVYIPAVQFSSD